MTYGEAVAEGYHDTDITYTRGYLERKTPLDEREVKTVKRSGGGRRKGDLYVEIPCYHSSKYHYRVYLKR